MSSEKQVALVTGASRGIGAAIAARLGASGYIVIGTATSQNGADKISERFTQEDVEGEGFVLNVTDDDSIKALMSTVTEKYGKITVLVNNAGITQDNLLMRMSDDEWSNVINTNLSSVFRLSKACLRGMMKSKWGRIVNISSVVGSMGNGGQSNYAATKAGVEGFTRSLAKEIGSRNITVNAIAPGFIKTDMTDALTEEQQKAMEGATALARLGEPNEIASVVDFLCGDGAAYITGETIHVNGGMYMG